MRSLRLQELFQEDLPRNLRGPIFGILQQIPDRSIMTMTFQYSDGKNDDDGDHDGWGAEDDEKHEDREG